MRMDTSASKLLLLFNWMSPTFPIGAYAYSHGLEWAIVSGAVKTKSDVESWITDVLTRGSGWNDAVLFVRASHGEDVSDLALALCSSHERHLETTQLGAAFAIAASTFSGTSLAEKETAYPIAAAMACLDMNIDCSQALLAFLQGFSNALISVAVRLVPLGQKAGLELMRDLMPVIGDVAQRAGLATLDDLGSCALLSDMAAIKHETQYSRVFRT